MPLQKLVARPGINRENTSYAGEGGWFDGDKIRFRSGFPEKIGGWTRLSNSTFLGTCRSLINWATLAGLNLLGIGTNLKYYIEKGSDYYDITPIVATSVYTNKLSTAYSTLNGGINDTQTTLTLTSGTNFPTTGLIKIGTEQIYYGNKTGNVLSGLIRGYNSTTAATHLTGAGVGCATITWADVDNDANNNDFVIMSGASAVGGISATVINAEHQVTKFTSGIDYFTVSEFSTSEVLNAGGAVTVQYLVPSGLDVYVIGTGWGAGPWSRGTWSSSYTTGIGQQLRLWTSDTYGEDLIFAPRGGALYYWDATTGVAARGQSLATLSTFYGYAGQFVPNATNQIISSAVQRFVISFGANSYDPTDSETAFDPLLVRWSDQENPYDWVPTATNQSGEQRLTNGSYIVCAKNTRQEILVWSDTAIYSMQYLGPPYVWGFTLLQDNISVISPNAAITVNNVTYWMGTDKFFMYSGRVETLPSTVRQYVYNDLNQDQAWQIFAGLNERYSEVWWYYPSSGSTVVDRYVVYNYLDRVWYYGKLNRTAWLDSGLREFPMAADYNNRILYHENGQDDVSGPSAEPIDAYITSSDFDIGDGHNFGFVWRILPDLTFDGSSVNQPSVTMAVYPRQNAGTPYGAADTPAVTSAQNYTNVKQYTVQQFDGQVYTRIRGRQIAFQISSDGLGVAWQLGAPRIDIRPDGRR
jgi:hypothetical protein